MLNAEVLTFHEFVTHEPLPLSKIQGAVLEFLQGRDDAVLFGAQAVNAYVPEPRATQDVDILSNRARELAEELREYLSERFRIAVRVREIGEGKGFRVYQTRKEGNRHLVDIRNIEALPSAEIIEGIQVLSPVELIASKVISYNSRRGSPKSGTDWRDIGYLLLKFPDVKERVTTYFELQSAPEDVRRTWAEILQSEFAIDNEEGDLNF